MFSSLSRCVLAAFLLIGSLYVAVSWWKLFSSPRLQDFDVYYVAAQDFSAKKDPYINSNNNYIYPPSSLVFIAPLVLFSLPGATLLWSLGSVAAMLMSFFFLSHLLLKRNDGVFIAVLTILSWWAFPLKFSLGMGQINAYLFLLLVAVLFYWQKKHRALAGLWLGLAIGLKLFPLFFCLFFVRKKDVNVLLNAAGTVITLHVLPMLWLGVAPVVHYYQSSFWQTVGGVNNDAYYNQSLVGLLARLHFSPQYISVIQLVSVISLFLVSFFATSSKFSSAKTHLLELGLFLCAWLIGERVSWQHYFFFVCMPLAAFFPQFAAAKNVHKTLTIFTILLIGWNIKNPSAQFSVAPFFYSHVLIGTVVLFFLILTQLHPVIFAKVTVFLTTVRRRLRPRNLALQPSLPANSEYPPRHPRQTRPRQKSSSATSLSSPH
jgi:hypothetical protein